jgi:hypothetical protein
MALARGKAWKTADVYQLDQRQYDAPILLLSATSCPLTA